MSQARQNPHEGKPEDCEMCQRSTRPVCDECGHALTGEFSNDGRSVCENCGKDNWIGVGQYND